MELLRYEVMPTMFVIAWAGRCHVTVDVANEGQIRPGQVSSGA